MGEFLKNPHQDGVSPGQDSKGMSGDTARYLQAVAMAGQLGKSVEECLAFLGVSKSVAIPPAPTNASQNQTVPLPKEEFLDPAALMAIPEDPADAQVEPVKPVAKAVAKTAKKPEPVADETGFVVTEVVDPADATDAEIDALPPEAEEENDWSGKIREGSKVKVVWQAPGSRLRWEGKKGKVVRIIGNEHAKVYEVEFAAGKILKSRINKKTRKLERGYVMKKLHGTFSEDQIELVD